MAVRQVEGAALLVAGHGAPGVGNFDASAVHTLGQIGEALLATGSRWQIRRLTATLGDRYVADRKTIKRSLATLVDDPVRIAVLVLLGEIVELAGELALVTGAEAHEYPEDATLPLSWIRDRLAHTKAQHLVIAMSACGLGSPDRWLGALGTQHEHHLVAIDCPTNGNPMIDAMLAGLCGDALDPQTGTVTMASLSKHLAGHARAVQVSRSDETVAQPPPLAGLWDVRHSQLANRPRPRRAPDGAEDLTGTVLPGRFRIDKLVARGTFGTVYRARQLAVERDIAIKVLHADIDPSSEDGKLFVHEIRSVGRIDHAHVVRIYQADITHDGRLFFAMELLDGQDLQTLGAAARMTKDRAVDLVRQLLAGLGAAHDSGLIHADIKPANAIVIPPRESETHERAVLVDFGLARLRAPGQAAESAGGTPAYMAPEQLHEGRVDARSDLFSLAFVLVWLLTGWRRPNAWTLVPPMDSIEDEHLRGVLARALDADPAKRFQTARELAAALAGTAVPPPPQASQEIPLVQPFRRLAPLTEADRGRLHGREADLAVITEHALYRRCVVYAAPSGTGKTSVLRAGLMPRLEALGIHAIYIGCRTDFTWSVVKAIAPGASSIADAITRFHEQRGGKLVLVVDQLEAALGDPEFVPALLGFDRWPKQAEISVVMAIREDWLARLLARTQPIEPNLPIVRLPPLSPEGARTAILAPLAEHRLGIEPALVDLLLADLERAASLIGQEMGWGTSAAVFPPHLQLACSVLYEKAIERGAPQLTLALYRELGGFDAIVGEHLDRVIDNELAEGQDVIARDLFVELVTSANQRAVRPEPELVAILGPKHGAAKLMLVLEALRSHGLLVSVRGDGEPSWELVHDSLIPRVLAWVDKKDLARRRAIELVRHHLRRSTREAPSLLSRKELRELRPHKGAVEELDKEWAKREVPDTGWTPSTLVAQSRAVWQRTLAMVTSVVVIALAVGAFSFYRYRVEAARTREMERLKALDLGRFELALEPFDWDPVKLQATKATFALEDFTWRLHSPDLADPDDIGAEFDASWVVRGQPVSRVGAIVESVEAHGGRAFLSISRGGCGEIVVPLKQLPGYAQRDRAAPTIHIRVPTCAAGQAGMIEIPEGSFVFGGVGDPPAEIFREYPTATQESVINLPSFAIDRTEVTNAQFEVFRSMETATGIGRAPYPKSVNLESIDEPRVPVTGLDWREARAFCRFLGKRLPTTEEWTKAMRGGEIIAGTPNPNPRRNLPWGTAAVPRALLDEQVARVGTHLEDVSPYGVLDLAGNVTEWTSSRGEEPEIRFVRGANFEEANTGLLVVTMVVLDNPRAERHRRYSWGVRCAM